MYTTSQNILLAKKKMKKLIASYKVLPHLMKVSNYYTTKGIQPPKTLQMLQFKFVCNVPKQDVANKDCAAFILLFIKYLTRNRALNFTSTHSKRL